jgi:exonuclease SbcC
VNPIAIRATNVRTFESLDLDLPTGCVVIAGENGAGKSTILNLIDVALFAERGELRALLSLGEEELTIELQFEHAGELYRVRRMYSGKGAGKTTLDLEHAGTGEPSDELWMPLTRETAIATQAYLEQVLGLSRATFRASSFLAQGDGAAFTDAQPRDRKAILAEILGLGLYDRLQQHARLELRPAEDQIVELRGKISRLEEDAAGATQAQADLATARGDLAAALEQHAAAEQQLEQAQQAHAVNAAAHERWLRAGATLAAVQADQERARVAYAAAVQAGIDREGRQRDLDQAAEVAATAAGLEERITAANAIVGLVKARRELDREADQRDLARERLAREATQLGEHVAELNRKADHLDAHIGEASECDRCGQTLGAEAAARAAASYRAEAAVAADRADLMAAGDVAEQEAVDELRERAAAIEIPETMEDTARLGQLLAAARAAGERRAVLVEQVRQLAEQAATAAELAIKLAHAADATKEAESATADAAAQVGDVTQLEQAVAGARATLANASYSVAGYRDQIARLEVAEQHAVKAADEAQQATVEISAIALRVDVLKLADRAFGRDGIPALIVENAAIPQLEVEANRILVELGGATADCRVELRTQRALKTADALRETLDIVIVTPAGERPYESFSGGERTRLNLALRIALARLLAHRRGAESRLLAIDEPEFLDEAGVARLADVLRGLSGDFDRILLVSHHPTLAAAFDQAIVVVKDGDRSRVGDAVAVPA